MNWDAIGAIGEILGAMLVGVTLIYLAIQLRQNTRAVSSSTILALSSLMSSNLEVFASHQDFSSLLVKSQDGLDPLTEEERARFGFLMMMAYRRIETVVVQRHLGFVDSMLTEGFERSALSGLSSRGAREWWDASKGAFSTLFSAWLDAQLAARPPTPIHVGLGLKATPMGGGAGSQAEQRGDLGDGRSP